MNNITSFFSSFIPTAHCDSEDKPEETPVEEAQPQEEEEEEEEEEEPEDIHPIIREECKESSKCSALAKHFEHCQEKVSKGEGSKGEECVEELMMHCVDECAAPKLFAKLR
ncbi:uncharacterized protein BT62DRAFT_937309 [Guyanagaster necrorhizus]|uniref:Ubiquinol-cytochrome C reductase hinge domain-containing protein n=1 Tax=Guyanagaster necrorhizus TaxID=856835 RepID=A0A9P8AN12_9AGAR|nr:uncharacterized protein BT62DRAFT_937309 [Guyanagaster necrorhizus MCA 3950]KAG7441276.1 hypothetical protein BT62DRAFT_937309 [Guyanagaster necrorhizus MCA 3950]